MSERMVVLTKWAALFLFSSCSAVGHASDAVSLVELPADTDSTSWRIAADGTAVGASYDTGQILRWPSRLPADNLGGRMESSYSTPVLISSDGSVIVATLSADGGGESPMAWRGGTRWEALAGMAPGSYAIGMSDNGAHLVGQSWDMALGEGSSWRWSAASGRVDLPAVPGQQYALGTAVSNDGSIVVGYGVSEAFSDESAVIWDAGGGRLIERADGRGVGRATACNSDCSIVVGEGAYGSEAPDAWRWTARDGVRFLGVAQGTQSDTRYSATSVTEDGSMIAGSWSDSSGGPDSRRYGFIWTARTGTIGIVDFLAFHGIDYGRDFKELSRGQGFRRQGP